MSKEKLFSYQIKLNALRNNFVKSDGCLNFGKMLEFSALVELCKRYGFSVVEDQKKQKLLLIPDFV